MNRLNLCPSTLEEGYDTYSPSAIRFLFDGRKISHIFAGVSPEDESGEGDKAIKNAGRISLSGVQSKFSVVAGDDGRLRYSNENEQGTFILEPRPTGYHIINKDYCNANEHVTMQIASQAYGIETAYKTSYTYRCKMLTF